jgi:pyruvate/oxaloacetate carboxyltransferase
VQVNDALPLPTDGTQKRVSMRVRVSDLLPVLSVLEGKGLTVDHIYDY